MIAEMMEFNVLMMDLFDEDGMLDLDDGFEVVCLTDVVEVLVLCGVSGDVKKSTILEDALILDWVAGVVLLVLIEDVVMFGDEVVVLKLNLADGVEVLELLGVLGDFKWSVLLDDDVLILCNEVEKLEGIDDFVVLDLFEVV